MSLTIIKVASKIYTIKEHYKIKPEAAISIILSNGKLH